MLGTPAKYMTPMSDIAASSVRILHIRVSTFLPVLLIHYLFAVVEFRQKCRPWG